MVTARHIENFTANLPVSSAPYHDDTGIETGDRAMVWRAVWEALCTTRD